jgi:hypothetical protein
MNMTQVVRICKYGCNTQLGQFDTKQNKYLESDGTLTWEDVKKQVKKEKEDEEKKWEEIRKYDAQESERLDKKSIFITSHSIKFTQDEYDKLKIAFCKGKGWRLNHPHTVNVHSVTLTGNYKSMPASDVKFRIEIEG